MHTNEKKTGRICEGGEWYLGECMWVKLASRIGILKWFIVSCRRKDARVPCFCPQHKSVSQSHYLLSG
jgi:hypothetical protein